MPNAVDIHVLVYNLCDLPSIIKGSIFSDYINADVVRMTE